MACVECGSRQTWFTKRRIASGAWQVREECESCGANARGKGIYVPLADVRLDDIQEVAQDVERPLCVVCDNEGAEWHHFAPTEVFGTSSGAWPGAFLCITHHREWHNRMIGYKFGRHDIVDTP